MYQIHISLQRQQQDMCTNAHAHINMTTSSSSGMEAGELSIVPCIIQSRGILRRRCRQPAVSAIYSQVSVSDDEPPTSQQQDVCTNARAHVNMNRMDFYSLKLLSWKVPEKSFIDE